MGAYGFLQQRLLLSRSSQIQNRRSGIESSEDQNTVKYSEVEQGCDTVNVIRFFFEDAVHSRMKLIDEDTSNELKLNEKITTQYTITRQHIFFQKKSECREAMLWRL